MLYIYAATIVRSSTTIRLWLSVVSGNFPVTLPRSGCGIVANADENIINSL